MTNAAHNTIQWFIAAALIAICVGFTSTCYVKTSNKPFENGYCQYSGWGGNELWTKCKP